MSLQAGSRGQGGQGGLGIPARLGRFVVEGVIGRGGMGVVYRGHDPETGQPVAIKVVAGARPSWVERFRAEIEALSRIRHPGVVRIFDEGGHAELPWYAMELLPSRTIRSVLSGEGEVLGPGRHTAVDATMVSGELEALVRLPPRQWPRLPPERAMALIQALCGVLAFLHGEGVVHGDLKPENVHIRDDGSLVLVDFGLVARFGGAMGREQVAALGGVAGTARYMAPERMAGDYVDARADLFALGAMFHELLTGRPPELPAVAPSRAGAAPGLDPRIDALVLHLLEPDPRHRLGHAEDVSRVLASLGAPPANPGADGAPRPRAWLYRPTLTARDDVLTSLMDEVDALATGQTHEGKTAFTLIEAESGLGKTRLMMELARRAQSLVGVVRGECEPTGSRPLQAFRPLLRAAADRIRAQQANGVEVRPELLAVVPTLAPYEPALAAIGAGPALMPLNSELDRRRVYLAVASLIRAMIADQPLLILIDDLQWCDDRSHAALSALPESPRLRVVAAFRPMQDVDLLESLVRSRRTRRVRLSGLDASSLGAVAADMLSLTAAPPGLGEVLAREAAGNPLQAAEALRAAVEEGLLTRDEGGVWGGVPALVQRLSEGGLGALLARRLDGLPARALGLARAAAVVGRGLDRGVLATVTGAKPAELEQDLEVLLRRQVIERDGAVLRFAHDAIRERCLSLTPEAVRAELHRRVADELRRSAEARGEPAPLAVLGEHLAAAGQHAEARQAFLEAAYAAKVRSALHEAGRLYRACLAVPGPGPEHVSAQVGYALDVEWTAGKHEAAKTRTLMALKEAERLGELGIQSDAWLGLAYIGWSLAEAAESEAAIEAAIRLGEAVHDGGRIGRALIHRSVLRTAAGEHEAAIQDLRRAIPCLDAPEDLAARGRALMNVGISLAQRGDLAGAEREFEATITLVRPLGERRLEAAARNNLGSVAQLRGDLDAAVTHFELALAMHRELGYARSESVALVNLAAIHAEQGVLEQAEAEVEEAMRLDPGSRSRVAQMEVVRALIRRKKGDLSGAQASLDRAEPLLRSAKEQQDVVFCLTERGHLALARGEDPTQHLAEARRVAGELGEAPGSPAQKRIAELEEAMVWGARRVTEDGAA